MRQLRITRTLLACTVGIAAVCGCAQLASAKPSATVVKVTIGKPAEFKFTLSKSKVPHGAVSFVVTNRGSLPHDFKVCRNTERGLGNSCTGTVTALLSNG